MGIQEALWERLPEGAQGPVKGVWRCLTYATGPARVLPDYLIIGTQRGGTTSLYEHLVRHPDIGRALTKEVRFFDINFHKGLTWYRAHFPLAVYGWARQRSRRQLVVGEATPDYLFDRRVPGRVSTVLPEVKIIVLLRNPIERAFSHYWHQVAKGYEHQSFEEAVTREMSREQPGEEIYGGFERHHYSYLSRGVYADQLRRWMDLFPKDQFYIQTSELLFEDAARVVTEVFSFLGLPDHSVSSLPVLNANTSGTISESTREKLGAYFAPHNQRLLSLLDRDLGWAHKADPGGTDVA